MKTKIITEFISERTFDIYDAKVGYHYFLVRSSGGDHNENIDLIFGGVLFVEIPSTLYGVKISKPCDTKSVELEKRFTTYQSANYDGELVYAIESGGERFNIGASGFWIHVNDLKTSSLKPMCYGDKKDYYSNYLKEEYKIG